MLGQRAFCMTNRDDAIENGLLIDVSEMAKKAGFSYPVAIEVDAYEKAVMWEKADSKRKGLNVDQETRLWQALVMCRRALHSSYGKSGDVFHFCTYVVPRLGNSIAVTRIDMKAFIECTHAKTVMTIALNDVS